MSRIFDCHFHFLLKHAISRDVAIDENIKATAFTSFVDTLMGGPLASQSSPEQIKNSPVYLGVAALLCIEHAYANRLLQLGPFDLSKGAPLDRELVDKIRDGKVTYFDEFKRQVKYYTDHRDLLSNNYGVQFLARSDWKGKTLDEIIDALQSGDKRYITFSIEGGHNLSNVLIHRPGLESRNPELQLEELQHNSDLDFFSLNLCHLSYIPEQHLGGFAQGANSLSQKVFESEDFTPKWGLGLTEKGKKVIRQALLEPDKPILIDVKHMSVYTRFDYYRYREKLIIEDPTVERLPIIASHVGFTFTSLDSYISNQQFKSTVKPGAINMACIEPENRKIGRTNDLVNRALFCNPWSINLFDEEIVEIMESRGMIGIILDQRVLGASNPAVDSLRDRYYEKEYIAFDEYNLLFKEGTLPGVERLDILKKIVPSRPERHIMLFCLHIVYAIQIGYAHINWIEGTSPWDCLCLGSDYDGLINPINGFETVERLHNLKPQLEKYLPQADKYLEVSPGVKALRYNPDGRVNREHLNQVIDTFLYKSGVRFIARFLTNWKE